VVGVACGVVGVGPEKLAAVVGALSVAAGFGRLNVGGPESIGWDWHAARSSAAPGRTASETAARRPRTKSNDTHRPPAIFRADVRRGCEHTYPAKANRARDGPGRTG
jgi:hypothetical protein